jgi:hypothetical protein
MAAQLTLLASLISACSVRSAAADSSEAVAPSVQRAPVARVAPAAPRWSEPPTSPSFNDRLWYRAPARRQRALSEQLVDQLTELGNELGTHLDVLTMELLALRVDGRRRRVHLGLGAGESGGYLSFHVGSDFHFIDGVARVTTRIELCIAGRDLALELPEMELAPTSYRGERGVEVRLPLIQKRF